MRNWQQKHDAATPILAHTAANTTWISCPLRLGLALSSPVQPSPRAEEAMKAAPRHVPQPGLMTGCFACEGFATRGDDAGPTAPSPPSPPADPAAPSCPAEPPPTALVGIEASEQRVYGCDYYFLGFGTMQNNGGWWWWLPRWGPPTTPGEDRLSTDRPPCGAASGAAAGRRWGRRRGFFGGRHESSPPLEILEGKDTHC